MKLVLGLGCLLGLVGATFAQRAFHPYPSVEYGDSTPLPSDWQKPGEWAFARLMYPPGPNDGYRGRFDGGVWVYRFGRRMDRQPIALLPLPFGGSPASMRARWKRT